MSAETVRDAMVPEPTTLAAGASAQEAGRCFADNGEVVGVAEILQRKFVGKAHDKFMLINAQRLAVLHRPPKRGTPLCDTLQGLPQTFRSAERSTLRHLRRGQLRDKCRNSLSSLSWVLRWRLHLLRLGHGWRGYGCRRR